MPTEPQVPEEPARPDAIGDSPLSFANSVEDAEARFARWQSHDPFPEIAPALLNSADLQDYVAATGMVFPFNTTPASMKPASYGVPLAGEVLYWEQGFDTSGTPTDLVKRSSQLASGKNLRLPRNSIVYVTLEPTLRLPDYIAVRFNLAIPEIYRGLLVGTGPLVDPGFVGQIHLPLHNYTYNEYDIVAGGPFVWMEFTKLSPNERWGNAVSDPPVRGGKYQPFPSSKRKRRVISDYLGDNAPVTSSIPRLVESAQRSAQDSASAAETAATRIRNLSIGAGIAIAIGTVAMLISLGAMLVSVWSANGDADRERDALRERISTLQSSLDELEARTSTAIEGGSAPTQTPTATATARRTITPTPTPNP